MYAVIFSSRIDIREDKDSNLKNLLDSFQNFTSEVEKAKSEFLIKFDDDDAFIPPPEFFNSYTFTIKRFTWGRHGGRSSLHEVERTLYNHVREDCQFVQIIADDFVFTRPNFVSEILSHRGRYGIIGEAGAATSEGKCPEGSGGYAPCFSTKIINAMGGMGPSCNADGLAYAILDVLKKEYNYSALIDFPLYYQRTDFSTTENNKCPFNQACKFNQQRSLKRLVKNIMNSIMVESNSSE